MRSATGNKKSNRKSEILNLLQSRDSISVQELAGKLNISLATARRDLDEMVQEGLVRRKFGSVEKISSAGEETPFALRATQNQDEKKRIARAALALVNNGDTIYISSGTTALELARLLPGARKVTVITNALRVANALADKPGIDLMLLGGAVRTDEQTLHGPLTEYGAQQFRANKMFYGVEAISVRHGLTHSQVIEVNTDRMIARMVDRVIVLADHSKFSRVSAVSVIPISEVDTVITGVELDPRTADELIENQVEVILA